MIKFAKLIWMEEKMYKNEELSERSDDEYVHDKSAFFLHESKFTI